MSSLTVPTYKVTLNKWSIFVHTTSDLGMSVIKKKVHILVILISIYIMKNKKPSLFSGCKAHNYNILRIMF